MRERSRLEARICRILLCCCCFLLASTLHGSGQGSGETAGSASEHPLSRTEHSLDLDGNVVYGAYTLALRAGTPAQTFEVVADTGSANLILLGDSSLCDNCGDEANQSLYSPSKSSTAQLSQTDFSLHYGSGSLQARKVQDQVAVGDLAAIDYTFAVATHQTGIQNILGLAYKAVAQPQGAPLTPYFDQLVAQTGIADVFSMRLCTEGQSKIRFGAAGVEVSDYVDIVEEKYYVIAPSKMQVEGGQHLGRFSVRAVVDSATTGLRVPASIHAKILQALSPVAEKNNVDLSHELIQTSAAVIEKFPVLQVVIKNTHGEEIDLDISPRTYFGKIATVGYRLLIGAMNTEQAILGTTFMENYDVVFDRAGKRIGFGSNAGCQATAGD